MSPFDEGDLVDRLFAKLDHIDAKIDDLCNRMTKQETKYDLHIEEGQKRGQKKERVFYGVLAFVGTVISLVEISRSGFLG